MGRGEFDTRDGEITDYKLESSPLFVDSKDSSRRYISEGASNIGEEEDDAIIMSIASFSHCDTRAESFHRDFASPLTRREMAHLTATSHTDAWLHLAVAKAIMSWLPDQAISAKPILR